MGPVSLPPVNTCITTRNILLFGLAGPPDQDWRWFPKLPLISNVLPENKGTKFQERMIFNPSGTALPVRARAQKLVLP